MNAVADFHRVELILRDSLDAGKVRSLDLLDDFRTEVERVRLASSLQARLGPSLIDDPRADQAHCRRVEATARELLRLLRTGPIVPRRWETAPQGQSDEDWFADCGSRFFGDLSAIAETAAELAEVAGSRATPGKRSNVDRDRILKVGLRYWLLFGGRLAFSSNDGALTGPLKRFLRAVADLASSAPISDKNIDAFLKAQKSAYAAMEK